MARIDIDINTVKNANYSVPQLVSGVSNVKKTVGILKWRVDPEILNRRNVRGRLESLASELAKAERELNDIYTVTEDITSQYLEREQILSSHAKKF